MTSPATVADRPDLADPAAWTFPHFATATVGNLTVHQLHLPGRGLVALNLHVDAPTTLDPPGLEGLAVLTARGLDEGSSMRDGDGFAAALDRIGADLDAGAGIAGTSMTLAVPAAGLAPALDLLAEAAIDPVFPDREIERLVAQRIATIHQHLANPAGRMGIVQREVMIADHRCAVPSGGTLASVAQVDRDMIVDFHLRHILTGPATLIVAGDLTGVDVPSVAADRLAPWVEARQGVHGATPVSVRSGPRVIVVDMPGAVQTQLLMARRGPDRRAGDWAAATAAAYVLGGTLTSRLDLVLREQKGYTYGMRTRLATYRQGGIAKLAAGSVDTDHTGESVRLALQIINDFAQDGPTAGEVAAAVDYMSGVRPLTLETPRALVDEVARNLSDDLPADHTDTELAALRALTRDEVAAAAATHLRGGDCTVIAVGDADAITADLDALGHAEVEVRRD